MKPREIDELARLVVEELAGGSRRGGNGGARTSPEAGGRADRPVGEPRAPSRWETPDLGWRMPMPQRAEPVPPASTGRPGGVRSGTSAPATSPSRAPDVPVAAPGARSAPARIADYVDHTLLKAETTRDQIERLCREAAEHRFAAVCVNGCWVAPSRSLLEGSGVLVATVVGFPLGAATSATKAFEAAQLVESGADELDMVAPIGHVLDGDWAYVEDDIRAVVDAAEGRTVKVILETGALEPLQIVKASAIAMEAGAQFVKTSTGFHPSGGATPEAVALMRLAVGDRLGVKAAGGVRDCASALRVIAAGATRIGTSSGVQLVECMGPGPLPLAELLRAPERHEAVCRTGNCPAVY